MTIFYYPELDNVQYDPAGPAARMPLPGFFKCASCSRFQKQLTPTKTPLAITMTCRMCSKK